MLNSFARFAFVSLLTASLSLPTLAQNPQPMPPDHRPAPASGEVEAEEQLAIRLPERFRVLTNQFFDVRIEAVKLTSANPTLKLSLDGRDVSAQLSQPEISEDNDDDSNSKDKAWTFRAFSIERAGTHSLQATITDGARQLTTETKIGVQDFKLARRKKSIVLMIGDAMGTAYRDAGRIVAKSVGEGFREGFFDDLQQMDVMPVSGMVMTHALDRVTPDSANTAAAWSMGNKTIDGALAALPDNNDFRFESNKVLETKRFALDNPRVETLWEYLKRKHNYRTGIVTTADVTDATPAAEGAHTISRSLGYDIAKQFVDGSFTRGAVYDVILGGGLNRFMKRTVENSGDARNLATELQASGYGFVRTRSELRNIVDIASAPNALSSPTTSSSPSGQAAQRALPDKLLGLFHSGNMNVAYDKLNLARPADEPKPDFGGFTDQPFLDEMADAAIRILSQDNQPFILMIEGASIDKQSHSNNFAGQLWDTIEFDKAVGVARKFVNRDKRTRQRTLLLVTADHDQSMSVIGVVDTQVEGAVENVRSTEVYPQRAERGAVVGGYNRGESDGFPDYEDKNKDGYPENDNRYKIGVGYRTGNHTGSSVPVTAEGAGAILFTGYQDQTDLFFKMARVLSSNTGRLDRALREREKYKLTMPNYAREK